jgi:hypothetical protein
MRNAYNPVWLNLNTTSTMGASTAPLIRKKWRGRRACRTTAHQKSRCYKGQESMSIPTIRKIDLIKKLDSVLSRWIRERDEGICPFCHQNEVDVCCHIIGRTKWRTRFYERNLVGGCSYCNGKEEQEAFMKDWFIERYSQAEWDEMEKMSNNTTPYTIQELEDLIKLYSV